MIKEQNITFDNFLTEEDYSIKENTEVLYLYFYDTTGATEYQLVGNKLEWRPTIWIEYEKERLATLKKLVLVSTNGKIDNFRVYLQRKFPADVVESYVFDQARLMNIILSKLEFKLQKGWIIDQYSCFFLFAITYLFSI